MDTQKTRLLLIFGIACPTTFASVICGDYQIVWSTIDVGGGTS